MRYQAFISYSHHDKAWGDWLHRALEHYKVPKALVGKATARGEGETVPARVYPVFRDREELPTSDDLNAMITRALQQSRYLIVICSPRSAQSRWVNEEILTYKRLGRENRVLAMIVDGSPYASEVAGRRAEDECLPPALRYKLGADGALTTEKMHPIAADAREKGDGRANALLKLLAGVLGVNYDELKRRDEEFQRRRVRRLQFAATTFALLMAFASLSAWLAWRGQRAIAARVHGEIAEQASVQPVLARGHELVQQAAKHRAAVERLSAEGDAAMSKGSSARAAVSAGLDAQRTAVDAVLRHWSELAPKFEQAVAAMPSILDDARALNRQTFAAPWERAKSITAAIDVLLPEAARLGSHSLLRSAVSRATSARQALQSAAANSASEVEQVVALIEQLRPQAERLLASTSDLREQSARTAAAARQIQEWSQELAGGDAGWEGAQREYWAALGAARKALARIDAANERWRSAERAWENYLRGFARRMDERLWVERVVQGPSGTAVRTVDFPLTEITGNLERGGMAGRISPVEGALSSHTPLPSSEPEIDATARAMAERLTALAAEARVLSEDILAALERWVVWRQQHRRWMEEISVARTQLARLTEEWRTTAAAVVSFDTETRQPRTAEWHAAISELATTSLEVNAVQSATSSDAEALETVARELLVLVRVLPPVPAGGMKVGQARQ